ncbi:MAG: type II toxin-antitoxin system mRNA interferase toxin, RelE/StbE family [bacterium]|nr:type II toxin-antitoxin system mRNA interferase toxin, RelE/StbE family [bacterium]
MKILYSRGFLKQASKLPKQIQTKLDTLIALLIKNPFHPSLHSKPLSGDLSMMYSFRIARDWRVIFCFEDKENIKLLRVGNRKDIYR